MKQKTKDLLMIVLFNAAFIAMIFSVLELLLLACMWFPSLTDRLPESLKFYPLKIYNDLDRDLGSSYSRWDPDLTYTVKPGIRFRWTNREYDIVSRSNRLGLRDNDDSLHAPEIIALGDSFTMGFGVEQEASFPQLLEKSLGLKVLNAGMNSYGTAREVILLNRRLDKSRLKYLLVQYCENDFTENREFISKGYRLSITPEDVFGKEIARYRKNRRYYFGKYLFFSLDKFRNWLMLKVSGNSRATAADIEALHLLHAEVFLETLSQLKLESEGLRLVLFDLQDRTDLQTKQEWLAWGAMFSGSHFIKMVKKLIAENSYPAFIEDALVLDTGQFLDKQDHFILDGHINAQGHAKVARKIIAAIK
ncbi:SGNH/GDSL hydrolase family protein [Thermodesulfobacteriota bacterium]